MKIDKLKIKNLFLIFSILNLSPLYSQVTGEGTGTFFEEISKLLIDLNKQKTKKIFIKANSFWERGKRKATCFNKTNFQIINDSIIKQNFQGETYLLKIKKNEIIELEYEKDRLLNERDSLNFRIYKNILANKTDTLIYINRIEFDSNGRIKEERNIGIGYNQKDSINTTRYFYEGDSIKYKRRYGLENNEWVMRYEEKLASYFQNGTSKKLYEINYKKNVVENEWIKERLTNYIYDKNDPNKIIGIEKFDYFKNEANWHEKHLLKIKYK